jgi:LPXTG-site transpeptidase (sortase) family protein
MLAVAAVGIGYPLWWNHRSSSGGAALLSAGLGAIRSAHATRCSSNPTAALAPRSGTAGVLEIPSIGLTAPVLDGLTDSVLNVAVGHDPGAPWPGAIGESVFEAHDVSYFAGLDHVATGAVVKWLTPCATTQLVVTGTAIRSPGDFIATPSNGVGLALITCYPTNALFWTNDRWVVMTRFVKETLVAQSLPKTTPTGPTITVPAPPSLVAENLTLQANEGLIDLNVMNLAGTPSATWREGPGPMTVETDAIASYIGAYKAITTHNRGWWSALAPGVAMPGTWPSFSSVVVTITMAGETPTAITLASSSATMHLAVVHDALHITSLS